MADAGESRRTGAGGALDPQMGADERRFSDGKLVPEVLAEAPEFLTGWKTEGMKWSEEKSGQFASVIYEL